MYLSIEVIEQTLEILKNIHPFFGTTFLACKLENLPVGRSIPFAISDVETSFLRKYYQTDKESSFFYTAFFTPVKEKRWISLKKYASSSLQSTRTRSVFKEAFIHTPGKKDWGWETDYLIKLEENLNENKGEWQGKRLPVVYLAAWLFRDTDWGLHPFEPDLIQKFLDEFHITEEETVLFDLNTMLSDSFGDVFRNDRIRDEEFRRIIEPPPDAKPDSGGLLASLQIRGTGPAKMIDFEPASRLNLITGDNGLGKTFLLETAWWALTGDWTGEEASALPDINVPRNEPRIRFEISCEHSKSSQSTFRFDWRSNLWMGKRAAGTLAGLTVYARVDGSYAIWDPTGNLVGTQVIREFNDLIEHLDPRERRRFINRIRAKEQIILNSREVLEGSAKMEGLLRDWVKWQNRPDRYPFAELCSVLETLSPPDMGVLRPGGIRNLPSSHLEIPTIQHPYGDVPITQTSAGIKRVISLAYLMVWAWNEHKKISEQIREEPQRRMVILIDELEAHLHPLWQRTILPALIKVGQALDSELKIQFIISTHSPMVMASAEPIFDEELDGQFHLAMSSNGEVTFEEKNFVEYGLIDYWLVSPTFSFKYPGSVPAETWIERAQRVQLQENPSVDEIKEISQGLSQNVSSTDPFWVHWLFFAEKYDIEI